MNNPNLLLLVLLYGGVLFVIAWLSDRNRQALQQPWLRSLIYALSIGVYCSSWTFLGAVGQSVEAGWHFLPIYLAPILVFVFAWRFLKQLIAISARNKVTSIADFIGSRYGKNQLLAAIVTVVLVVGTLPYIALQLRAVGIVWSWIESNNEGTNSFDYLSSLIAALIMALFAILFGTRVIEGPDRLRGMVNAVATESIVKLVAFIAVAFVAFRVLSNSGMTVHSDTLPFHFSQIKSPLFLTEMLLAASAIVLLPRQFQLLVVEHHTNTNTNYLRWLMPIYLGLFALLVFPIASAGAQIFSGEAISPDSYVLALPAWLEQDAVLYLTIIGSLSAATGMVVVSSIALSIMISNELVVPLWLRYRHRTTTQLDLAHSLRFIRRGAIIFLLLLGWLVERLTSSSEGLASMGLISFAASAQLLPAVVGAVYWKRGHARGVICGLIAGMSLWFYCLLLPILLPDNHSLVNSGLFGITWLSPQNLLGMGFLDSLSHGVFWSLLINTVFTVLFSTRANFSPLDLRQTAAFTRASWHLRRSRLDLDPSGCEVGQLQSLMEPLFGVERTLEMWREFEQTLGHRLFPHDQTPRFVVNTVERNLAAIIGAVSARKAIELLNSHNPIQLKDFVSLVGGSSRQIQFSQALLQTTLETIPQGISVVDRDLKLVAWNQQYQSLFDYPVRFLYIGCDIEKIYRFNAERGFLKSTESDVDLIVEKRLQQLRSGKAHRLIRELPTGKVIEIRGTPLVNGGYVTTFTDITDTHDMMRQLEEAKQMLEIRVDQRTTELRLANESLQKENIARSRLEEELKEAHSSKSRFLTAVGHDLLQPINASRLFVSALESETEKYPSATLSENVMNLGNALHQAERLINSLREISRLGSGKERPKLEHFRIDTLLQPLAQEARALAQKKNIEFHFVNSSQWAYSDPHLLRRVLQNFISNALFYTKNGKVLLGCRRRHGFIRIEVWDTGPGISAKDQERIFNEFERLANTTMGNQGLGLGLTIAQHISRLLNHRISLASTLGKGSVFKIDVAEGLAQAKKAETIVADPHLTNLSILCIDNDQPNLAGMHSLLTQWGCRPVTATDLGQAINLWPFSSPPDLVLADYHLDNETGLDVLEALKYHWDKRIPAIVISADNSDEIVASVAEAGYLFLAKPVKAPSLRNMIRKAINEN